MTQTGRSRRRRGRHRGAADAGNTTGVATAVLALLSAGALATLGLVTASEITSGFPGSLGFGPGSGQVQPPPGVVVTGGQTERPGGGGSSTGGPSGGTAGPATPPVVVPPLTPDITNELPTPAGLGGTPAPAVPAPEPGTEPAPPPAPEPDIVLLAAHGRSGTAPGHTKVERLRGNGADGRAWAAGRTAVVDEHVDAAHPELTAAGSGSDDSSTTATATAPGQVRLAGLGSSGQAGGSATAPGRLRKAIEAAAEQRATSSGRGNGLRGPAAASAPVVVPTPAASLLVGPPGQGIGLANGQTSR